MKLPKETKRYCAKCKKHTAHKISIAKQRSRGSARPMSRWANFRTKKRSYRSGSGNLGRFSKPAVKSWKRKIKTTKRMTILYTCTVCKKIKGKSRSTRAGRIEIGEKVAK